MFHIQEDLKGAPDQWETSQAQFEEKVICLNVIWGEQIFISGVKSAPQEEACC